MGEKEIRARGFLTSRRAASSAAYCSWRRCNSSSSGVAMVRERGCVNLPETEWPRSPNRELVRSPRAFGKVLQLARATPCRRGTVKGDSTGTDREPTETFHRYQLVGVWNERWISAVCSGWLSIWLTVVISLSAVSDSEFNLFAMQHGWSRWHR